jgi:hypothetical protein
MNTITGMSATGGKNTMPDGRISTTTIGSSISAASRGFVVFR